MSEIVLVLRDQLDLKNGFGSLQFVWFELETDCFAKGSVSPVKFLFLAGDWAKMKDTNFGPVPICPVLML